MADEAPIPLLRKHYVVGDVLLDKYRLLEKLAVGGMGEVWRAKNEVLQVEVAVKVMFELGRGSAKVAVERAHTEARLAAQLHHPAVCSALDFGISERGEPLVVSELLHGSGLDELILTEGPLPPARAAQLILPILDALGAAHDKGIIHRDVKPSNIFLARDEHGSIRPKLLDFGIARGLADDHRITMAGVVCGTPDYMSPEQARGSKDVDARSDVWSVCATLYEMVAGRPPFRGDNYNEVMFKVIHEPYPPIRHLLEADAELAAILERGLTKQRAARFQSTRELARSLSQFLLQRGVDVDVCGVSLRSRLSSSASLPVSEAEQALVERITARASQIAVTMPRAVASAPRHERPSLAPVRKRPGHRRWLLTALATASLLGLAAWSSRPLARASVEQQDLGAGAVIEPPALIAEVVEPPAVSELGLPDEELVPAVVPPPPARGVAPKSPKARSTNDTSQKRAPKPRNALGYDFGI